MLECATTGKQEGNMAVPKIIGTEIEYGVMVPNDPDFDPIAVSLLLVNSYHGDPQRRLLWDYDQEEPFTDASGFEVDVDFEPPDDQSNMSINTTLTNGARYYLDHAHPEVSTPGCTNARDIVRYEKAADRIVEVSRARDEPHANRDTRLFPGDGAQEVPRASLRRQWAARACYGSCCGRA
jgi:Pup amidohydrolase